MPESDLPLLIAAAHAAARAALNVADSALDIRHKSEDGSPVTAADLAANHAIAETLRPARPDYAWLSEESPDDGARQSAKSTFIIDPIDGTRAFIEGSRAWAHALAVVEDGQTVAGVVYLPRMQRLYAAARGQGATLNGAALQVSDNSSRAPSLLATKATLASSLWRDGPPKVERVYRPSLAYRLCLVAQGRFDGMATLRASWDWDIAAGALIVAEAGGTVSDQTGKSLRFNAPRRQSEGVVAANPGFHAQMLDHLTAT